MAKGWWHEGTVNGHYVLHQRVHVPAAAIDISPKEAYVGEGVSLLPSHPSTHKSCSQAQAAGAWTLMLLFGDGQARPACSPKGAAEERVSLKLSKHAACETAAEHIDTDTDRRFQNLLAASKH